MTFSSGITTIGDSAFGFCTNLTTIAVDALNPVYSSLGGVLFNKNQTTLIGYPEGKAGSYTVPAGVTTIRSNSFLNCTALTGITLPDSLTTIGDGAFYGCSRLGSITLPDAVTNLVSWTFGYCTSLMSALIGNGLGLVPDHTFYNCTNLASVTMGHNVASIEAQAFQYCSRLTTVTVPSSVTNVAFAAFSICPALSSVYFQGNAPSVDPGEFFADNSATVYYRPGTKGWGPTYGGRPTALWPPQVMIANSIFGVRANKFGFTVQWDSGGVIVVEACTHLARPTWLPLATNALSSGSFYFRDSQWTNYPRLFYRLRSP